MSFIVKADGGVLDVKIIKHYKAEFDTAAINAVAAWRFEPATNNGKPVAVRLESEIKFTPMTGETS